MPQRTIKVCLIGDGNVGKTSLLTTYLKRRFFDATRASGIDRFSTTINISTLGKEVEKFVVEFQDNGGQVNFLDSGMIDLSDQDVIIACYEVVSVVSFENLMNFWIKKVRQQRKHVPIVLVGTKKDLRGINVEDEVPVVNLRGMEQKICAALECSAQAFGQPNNGVDAVFKTAIEVALKARASATSCNVA